jgi:hypothetical protein
MPKGRKPDMPEIGTERYTKLVNGVACYGWNLGSALVECVTYHAYYRWRSLAGANIEPYATWVPQFQADLRAAKARYDKHKH